MNKLWIIQNDFSQEWGFSPSCFFKCTKDHNKDQMEMLDRYAVKVVGDDPALWGYVKMEGIGNVDSPDTRIVFCADSPEDLDFIYGRIADSFLHHPGVIDLRGDINIRII